MGADLFAWRSRLSVKIYVPALLAAALATTTGSFLLQQRITRGLEDELEQQSRGLVQTLQTGVEHLARAEDMDRFLAAAGTGRLVRGVWLVGGNPPRVLSASHQTERGLPRPELVRRWPGLDLQGPRDDPARREGELVFHRQARLSADLLPRESTGPVSLFVVVDHRHLERRVDAIARQFLLARACVLTLILASLSLVFHYGVLRPLSRLERQVGEVEAGAPPERIRPGAADEIGRLAQAVRRALTEVREERSRFALLAERNPALIYRCRNDEYWTMEYMSRAARDLTGRAPEDFIGNALVDYESVIHPDDRDLVREGVERGLAGDRSWDIEYRVLHADGRVIPVRVQGRGHIDPGTGQWILDGIILDLSQRRLEEELQRQLQDLERVRQEGLRTMAGSVAHHFNNLLTGLMGGLDLALQDLREGRSPQDELDNCREITDRAAALSRLMLLYVGEGQRERKALWLGPHVQARLAARRREGLATPVPELEGSPGGDRVQASGQLLDQLIDELLDNAREAAPERVGAVRLRAGWRVFQPEELAQAQVPIVPDPAGNPFIEVIDAAGGMSPEVLERAFDPFYTTKFTGRGLGLAAVLGIARLHRGGLICRSDEGRGTRITVLLPRHSSA